MNANEVSAGTRHRKTSAVNVYRPLQGTKARSAADMVQSKNHPAVSRQSSPTAIARIPECTQRLKSIAT